MKNNKRLTVGTKVRMNGSLTHVVMEIIRVIPPGTISLGDTIYTVQHVNPADRLPGYETFDLRRADLVVLA